MENTAEEKCGATRDFLLGTENEGKIISVCEKPKGHDPRGPHVGKTHSPKGEHAGRVSWRGDDRATEA